MIIAAVNMAPHRGHTGRRRIEVCGRCGVGDEGEGAACRTSLPHNQACRLHQSAAAPQRDPTAAEEAGTLDAANVRDKRIVWLHYHPLYQARDQVMARRLMLRAQYRPRRTLKGVACGLVRAMIARCLAGYRVLAITYSYGTCRRIAATIELVFQPAISLATARTASGVRTCPHGTTPMIGLP